MKSKKRKIYTAWL